MKFLIYVSNTKWFDFHFIYSDEVKLQTARVYLDFQFMGHKSATDPIQTFKDVHHNLNYFKNLLQISMGSPNVNWKISKLVKKDRKIQHPSSPDMLQLVIFMLCMKSIAQDKIQQIRSLENH